MIYLDYNATTPIAELVERAMSEAIRWYGNPSSLYAIGMQSRAAIEGARHSMARLINCIPGNVVFTGCGSESNNTVLKGLALSSGNSKKRIITSCTEHPSVLGACRWLQELGFEVELLPVDKYGRTNPDNLENAMDEDTFLVSIMLANNETGVIQPVAELAAIAHKYGAAFHTDAVQAVGKIPVDVVKLGVDFLSISGHKFYAPKGVGVLFVREGIQLDPLISGGNQEHGLRAGTENTVGIVGLGRAAELVLEYLPEMSQVQNLRDRLQAGITDIVPGAILNGHPQYRLPNTLNMTLPGIRGEAMVMALDQRGIAISSGSACHSGFSAPSYCLTAMGLTDEQAHCSLRFSLGPATFGEEIDQIIEMISEVIRETPEAVRFVSWQ